MKRVLDLLIKHEWLVILLFVVFVLRVPTLFEPHRYADEEIYLTLGNGLRKGLVFYRDIHDNKPPLLYITAAVAGNLFWFRLILMAVHAAGVVFFWWLARLVFTKRWAQIVSTSLFALLSTLPWLEGNIANGENFMIVPATLGAYLLYQSVKKPKSVGSWEYVWIGLLFSMAFLFKVPIAFDFAGLLLFWIFFASPKQAWKKRLRRAWSRASWWMVGGFVVPIILSVAYYSLVGAGERYVRSALLQNIGYLSSWSGAGEGPLTNPLVWKGLVVIGVVGAVAWFSKKLSREVVLIVVWSTFSMYGALLSNRPYPHYLLQSLVPMCLLFTQVVRFIKTRTWSLNFLVSFSVFVLLLSLVWQNGFWRYRTWEYYENFGRYAVGAQTEEAYRDYFPGTRRNYEIASYLLERSNPHDRLFVWGTEPSLYALTGMLPVGRYTASYHIEDFDAFDETYNALQQTPPKFIVIFSNQVPDFPALESLIEANYVLLKQIDEGYIYLQLAHDGR